MTPANSIFDVSNGFYINSIEGRKIFRGLDRCSDLVNLTLGKQRPAVKNALILSMPSSTPHINHVSRLGACVNMFRVTAGRVVTMMQYIHVFRDYSMRQHPRNAVRSPVSCERASLYYTVSTPVPTGNKLPAVFGYLKLLEKPKRKCFRKSVTLKEFLRRKFESKSRLLAQVGDGNFILHNSSSLICATSPDRQVAGTLIL